ncbi:hypothetical protein GCK72_007058 [Caenorhabditis remanei]|uniref:Uncharacterized protein n=1 Tax=Caenorhabditis remanei TaxID=31234 RepID=A0A6A5HGG8_CAERE|nr:hypothetical protein GCK72_007058 [Caenorhabditis remanei]KAF1767100.1 hypothetical protein GCK72_007058 [Caenorhabditis remanei]
MPKRTCDERKCAPLIRRVASLSLSRQCYDGPTTTEAAHLTTSTRPNPIETLHNVVVEHLAHFIGDVSLWIHFSDVLDRELLIRHVLLVLQRLLVVLRQLQHRLQMLLVRFATLCVVLHTHCVHPRQFVEIQQHLLLQIVCSRFDKKMCSKYDNLVSEKQKTYSEWDCANIRAVLRENYATNAVKS